MMHDRPTSAASFFDAKYRDRVDPWDFETDPYECARYGSVLTYVDPLRHRRVFEPGCSIGVLTEQLARQCDTVHATDISPIAVQRTRDRCSAYPGVTVSIGGVIPHPGELFDLVVFSEIGYYLDEDALAVAVGAIPASVAPRGRFLAAHWIGYSPDHILHGFEVHRVLHRVFAGWTHRVHDVHVDRRRDGFVIDVWDCE
jgi:SAM-dependent methyltransferase